LAGADVTIKNGSIAGGQEFLFATGIYVNASATGPYGNGGANPPIGGSNSANPPSNITIDNVFFRTNVYGIVLVGVSNSTVENCYFWEPGTGIWDYKSAFGNTYTNNTFDEVETPFVVTSSALPLTQQRCVFTTAVNP
jgi:parallel beta-helix repeat protein